MAACIYSRPPPRNQNRRLRKNRFDPRARSVRAFLFSRSLGAPRGRTGACTRGVSIGGRGKMFSAPEALLQRYVAAPSAFSFRSRLKIIWAGWFGRDPAAANRIREAIFAAREPDGPAPWAASSSPDGFPPVRVPMTGGGASEGGLHGGKPRHGGGTSRPIRPINAGASAGRRGRDVSATAWKDDAPTASCLSPCQRDRARIRYEGRRHSICFALCQYREGLRGAPAIRAGPIFSRVSAARTKTPTPCRAPGALALPHPRAIPRAAGGTDERRL